MRTLLEGRCAKSMEQVLARKKKRKYFAPKRQFKAEMLNRESPSISENTKTINLAT